MSPRETAVETPAGSEDTDPRWAERLEALLTDGARERLRARIATADLAALCRALAAIEGDSP
jgi:hypothetical protein